MATRRNGGGEGRPVSGGRKPVSGRGRPPIGRSGRVADGSGVAEGESRKGARRVTTTFVLFRLLIDVKAFPSQKGQGVRTRIFSL